MRQCDFTNYETTSDSHDNHIYSNQKHWKNIKNIFRKKKVSFCGSKKEPLETKVK